MYYTIVGMAKIILIIKNNIKWCILVILIILSGVIWFVAIREDRGGKMTVSFLNIGQGDSIFIESPTGTQVLVDGGPDKAIMKEIGKVMPWYDRHIDMIVVTNPDKDHFEGFIPLLDKYSVDVEMEPGTKAGSGEFDILQNELKMKKVSQVIARRGQIVDLGGGAFLQILFPDRDVSGLNTNNGSIVMKLIYGKTSVLLTGDSPVAIEDYLISIDGENLKSTILKAGHHGSRTSTSEEYVKVVRPEYAVISAGKDNKYGHPHKETLEILAKQKVPILGTFNLGRVTLTSDGSAFANPQSER